MGGYKTEGGSGASVELGGVRPVIWPFHPRYVPSICSFIKT